MKTALILAVFAAMPSSPQAKAAESLMDEIERQVRLPAEARPLDEYGRYYFFDGEGGVKALYVYARDPRDDGSSPSPLDCTQGVSRNGNLGLRAIPCPADPAAPRQLRAGRRQWVAARSAAPTIHDGGCIVVHVSFDLKTRRVHHVGCNGYA